MPSPTAADDQEPIVIDEEASAEDDDATRPAIQEAQPEAVDVSMLPGGEPLNPTLLLQAMLGMANFMGPQPAIVSPPVVPPMMPYPFGTQVRPGAHFRPVFPATPLWHPQLGYPGPAPPQMQRPVPIRPSTSSGAFTAPREVGAMKRLARAADWVHLNASKEDGCIDGWPSHKKLRVVLNKLKIKQMDTECTEVIQRVVKRLVMKLLEDAKVNAAESGHTRIRRQNILNVLHRKS